MSTEPEVQEVSLYICDLCLDGVGGECHVPGCAFWMVDAPGVPLSPLSITLAAQLGEARALLDAWCTAAADGEDLGPLRAQTLAWLGGGGS